MFLSGQEVFLSQEHTKYKKLRLGVLCHPASVNKNLEHLSTTILKKNLGLNIACFLGPQHGIRSEKQDNMIESSDFIDPRTGLPVISLYSSHREPTSEHLKMFDAIVVDLQDVGTRIYTYIYTMANCMKAAKKYNRKVIILDRPNPINGVTLEGNVLEPAFSSFVGQYPICTRHGMTIGELALLFNSAFDLNCDLDVIRMRGWKRNQYWDELKREWIPPSPNIPTLATALVFPGTVLFEGTNVSEGRGTTRPFEWVGAPFIDPDLLCRELNQMKLGGVYFRPIYFQPTYQKHKDQVCGGTHIHVTDRKRFRPVEVGQQLLYKIATLFERSFQWKQPPYEYEFERLPIDLIVGSDRLRKVIESRESLTQFDQASKSGLAAFLKLRKEFLLYS